MLRRSTQCPPSLRCFYNLRYSPNLPRPLTQRFSFPVISPFPIKSSYSAVFLHRARLETSPKETLYYSENSAGKKERRRLVSYGMITAAFVLEWPTLSMINSLFQHLDKASIWLARSSRAPNVHHSTASS